MPLSRLVLDLFTFVSQKFGVNPIEMRRVSDSSLRLEPRKGIPIRDVASSRGLGGEGLRPEINPPAQVSVVWEHNLIRAEVALPADPSPIEEGLVAPARIGEQGVPANQLY